jgi:hypothetical protein
VKTKAVRSIAFAVVVLIAASGPSCPRVPVRLPSFKPPSFKPPSFKPPSFKPPKFEPPKFEPPKFEPPKFEPPKFEPPKFEPPPMKQTRIPLPPKVVPNKGIPLPLNVTPARASLPTDALEKVPGRVDHLTEPLNSDWLALSGGVDTALRDPHLPLDVRANLLAVRHEVAPLKALAKLHTALEVGSLPKLNSEVFDNIPEPVRRLWQGLDGLEEIGTTLARPWKGAPDPATLAQRLTNVNAATSDPRLTARLKGALIAKAKREGHPVLARTLRDLKIESVPVGPPDPPRVPVLGLVPEAPGCTRAGQVESVWEGLPELKDSATKASRHIYRRLTAQVRWHSEFHHSLAHTQVHLAIDLHRQTEPDERRDREKRRDSLAAVERGLSCRLTPAERIIAADMLRRGRSPEAVKTYLQRFNGK